MKLGEHVYLVGSGAMGFDLTHPSDCHVYLIDGGSEQALVDAGAGPGVPEILANVREHGFSLDNLRYLLLTHAHADHAGGAARLRRELGVEVVSPRGCADFVRNGDEDGIGLTRARQAGLYPEDYRFEACPVERTVAEGDEVRVGSLALQVWDTPGHAAAHVSYEMMAAGKRHLLAGDVVFFGGRICLLNVADCSLQQYVETVEKLARLSVDALLPGHLAISLRDGRRHIDTAAQAFARLTVPPNIL